MRLSRYLRIFPAPDTPDQFILYSTRRHSILRVREKTLLQIEDGALPEADRKTLVRYGILVPDPAKEREELLSRFDTANRKSGRFRAIVVLNLDCNLACGYCFEEGVRGKRSMSRETADLLTATVVKDQMEQGRRVTFEFYGGEPLLSPDLIRSIASRLKESSEVHGTPFDFYLVTNGTLLTRPLALEFKDLGMKGVMITIDGPREVHDRSRPFVSGRGSSFDVIVKNILSVMEITDVQIVGNFTPDNYRDFPPLLDHLLSVGITPDKVEVVSFSPVTERIGSASAADFVSSCNCTNKEWLCEATVFLREEILKRGFPTPKPGPAGCMIEFDNALVVNVDGAIYKCPAFIGREGFSVGSLKGGIGDSSVYGPDIWKREECLDCPWLPMCFGGCRFIRFLREGEMKGVDCWKGFLDATIEKCVLQDLKYRPRTRNRSTAEPPV